MTAIAVEKSVGKTAEDAIRWLDNQRDWLLILDSADDPQLNLDQFIPRISHGNTIITSRNEGSRSHGLPSQSYREILSMDPAEALELFLRRAGIATAVAEYRTSEDHETELAQKIVKV